MGMRAGSDMALGRRLCSFKPSPVLSYEIKGIFSQSEHLLPPHALPKSVKVVPGTSLGRQETAGIGKVKPSGWAGKRQALGTEQPPSRREFQPEGPGEQQEQGEQVQIPAIPLSCFPKFVSLV